VNPLRGTACGLCGSQAYAPDDDSHDELMRVHMIMFHPESGWEDMRGNIHKPFRTRDQ
jgi:hypothetical protein